MQEQQNFLSPEELQWIKQHPVIKVSGPRSFPPFHFYKNGQAKGIAVDYLQDIAEKTGLTFETQPEQQWWEVLKKAEHGEIDLIICLGKTDKRMRYLDFTDPYLRFPLVIVTREQAPFIGGLDDLKGKTIALVPKTITEDWLLRDGISFTPHYVLSPLDGLEAVSFNQADATIENLASASYFIQNRGITNLKIAAPTSYEEYRFYMAASKNNPLLISIINKALPRITPAKTQAIRNDWLSVRFDHGIRRQDLIIYITVAIACSLLILSVVLIWNRKLKKETLDRKNTEKALRESKEKLRNVVENSTNMFYSHTPDHIFTYISPQCQSILECTPEECRTRWTEFLTDNEINLKGIEYTEQAIQTGQRQPPYELELQGKNGRITWVEVRETPVIKDGKTIAIVGSASDITERKNAEKESEELRNQLLHASKMEAIGTLAGGVAHEFNNILSIILGNAELAMVKILQGQSNGSRPYIEEVRSASIRAKEVIERLLSFSRKNEQSKEMLDLAGVIRETVSLMRATISSSITIQQYIEEPLPPVYANRNQMQQLLINICTNSVQAMEDGWGSLAVRLTTENARLSQSGAMIAPAGGSLLKLTIEDTGAGIACDILDRIFDPYFTTRDIGHGSGMGLAIAHGIVIGHGGTITVSSEQDKGTLVTILLPACDVEIQEQMLPNNQKPSTGTESILLIDDEEALALVMQQLLKALGYNVTVHTRAATALDQFSAAPEAFDIVISDLVMPDMSGLEATKAIKSIRPDIPIILCTGNADLVTPEAMKAAGAAAIIMKPIPTLKIAQRIRETLDSKNNES